MHQHVLKLAENAPAATYGGAAATTVLWGLHMSEICMLLSTFVSVMGLCLQMFLAMHRIRRVERHLRHAETVVEAVATSHRAMDEKKADKPLDMAP